MRPLGARLRATRPRVRIVGVAALLAVGLAVLPSTGAIPFGAGPLGAPGQGGSDRIAEVTRQIRQTQAQITATETQVATLARRRDQMAAELEAVRIQAAELADLQAQARAEARSTAKALKKADRALEQATATRAAAKKAHDSAESALTAAQDRLEQVSGQADQAQDAVRSAHRRVEQAKSGSKARRTAFTAWQMAAVADRAAHARQVLADDRAADEFVGMQAAEAVLTEADFAEEEAESAQAKAARAADKAAARLAEVREDRAAAKAAIRELEPELVEARAAHRAASALLGTLTKALTRLQQSATIAGEHLAVGRPGAPARGSAAGAADTGQVRP